LSKGQGAFGKFDIKITKTRKDGQLVLRVVTAQRFEVNIYKCDGIYAVFGGLYVRMYHCRVLYTMLCFRGYSLKMKDC
jgi:hypothetical protein